MYNDQDKEVVRMRILGLGIPELVVIAIVIVLIALPFLPLIVMGVNWKHGKDAALRRGAWAGVLLSTIGCALMALSSLSSGDWGYVIPLIWLIPLTYMGHGVMKGERPNTVALGVCTLLFASLISGILLLCSEKGSVKTES